ncbi:hypothetical protein OU798_15900 [Prolixibacteraceae bacterium Z1-6]|uniref:Uncharacterized protein n=1 Tax=Draconibacterium aestuarii TaxID=2998507 RepID=A0A9X3FFM2_9BACT|nr:hypothetical protein [Prolixibacteraceae bacterium Z1-6]
MKPLRSKATNNFSWIIVIVLLIILYASYFFLFIPKQEMLVKERGFRILERYAENMHHKHDYYASHFKIYSAFYAIRQEQNFDSLEVWVKNRKFIEKDSLTISEILGVVNGFDKQIKAIPKNAYEQDDFQDTNRVSTYVSKYKQHIFFNLNNITYEGKHNDNLTTFKNTFKKIFERKKSRAISFEIKSSNSFTIMDVPVSKLMENLKFDQLFENIALLDSAGIIYNSNGSIVNDITNLTALNDTISKTQGGVFQNIEIQGTETNVLFLPINFLDQKFYLAGFIPNDEYRKKTRTFNSQLLTIFSGIILLLLIGMPILKIVFINRKERLNVRDVNNATVSLILGVSLLILLFIGTMKYYVVDRHTSRQRIETISSRLCKNVESDFKHILNLADTLLKASYDSTSFLTRELNSVKMNISNNKIFIDSIPFNEIILMNDHGMAQKTITHTPFSDLVPIDLSSRNYFRSLDENFSWPCRSSFNDSIEAFYIESIKSYNTSKLETAVSFRLKSPVTKESKYLAITSDVPSLYHQVLPRDVTFLIINGDGNILYHSNELKNLQENFLVEINHNPKIEGSIRYRTEVLARITYNEKKWLARIVPLPEKPLYHVTLIDLNYTDNKNTRIYLFTFYFLLFTFVCIVLGKLIIHQTAASKRFMKSKTWPLKWILFRPDKEREYTSLLILQSLLLLCQLLGAFLLKSAILMLFYQLVFIAFSGVTAYVILYKKATFGSVLLLMFIVAVSVAMLFWISIPNSILVIVLLVVLILIGTRTFKLIGNKYDSGYFTVRQKYMSYMLIWLLCLSAVPVTAYYLSIRYQEEVLAQKNEMLHLASENVVLHSSYKEAEKAKKWLEAVNGSKLDSMDSQFYFPGETDRLIDKLENSAQAERQLANADIMYYELPSVLTGDNYLNSLLYERNTTSDWVFIKDIQKTDSVLLYRNAENSGVAQVKSSHLQKIERQKNLLGVIPFGLKPYMWVLIFILPLFVLGILILTTVRYLADILLGTITAKWKTPNNPQWTDLLKNEGIKHILLLSFNGQEFLDQAKSLLKKGKSTLEEPGIITAEKIVDKNSNVLTLVPAGNHFVWITGMEAQILDYKKGDMLLSRLNVLGKHVKAKLIFELPFDTDYIKEYFQDYIVEHKPGVTEEMEIESYLNGLQLLFKDYFRFTGKVKKETIEQTLKTLYPNISYVDVKDEEEQILADAHLLKLQFSHIWKYLTRMEKLILFDLADDGLLNFKNRFLINRLRVKGLVELEPYPKIFSSAFRYFLKYSVDEDEKTGLEQMLGRQGKWKNTKYLLLLLLIPLAAFMVMSQGLSIEKVIGILTGVVALFSGTMRLMDTSWFGKITKP